MASKTRRLVVLGFLGTNLDVGKGPERWERWRPTVSLFQQEELMIHRFELLFQAKHQAQAEQLRGDIARLSPDTEVRFHSIDVEDAWDFEQVYGSLHDFAKSISFDTEQEDYWVHITTGTHVAQICLFLLVEARYIPGKILQTSPPRAETKKRGEPAAGTYTTIDLDLSKYDQLASRFRAEQREGLSFLKAGIDTKNAAFNQLMELVERVAVASRAPMLLTGPTGAGKTRLARRIFELKKSRRQVQGEFAELNCATLRGDTAQSALFGHVKGAFTGAVSDRAGVLKKAHQGVLFLDEIGELGPDEQAMLLRAIEDKVFLPVGSDREVRSEFQLLAGTNRDLREDVLRGKFREDLLERINLWTFRLPALRERPEDIAPNLEFELESASRALGTRITFSREAKERYLRFATGPEGRWPGNFRELNASVVRMTTLAEGGRITVREVDDELLRLREAWKKLGGSDARERSQALVEQHVGDAAGDLDRFDRVQLEDVLSVCMSAKSLSDAGRTLFAKSREKKANPNDADRLRKYLARFSLSWARLHPSSGEEE